MDDARLIEHLLYRYAECIDAGDLDGLGRLFAHGAVLAPDGTELAAGAEAVTAFYGTTTRLHDDGTPQTTHQVTNPIVEIDDDAGTATCRSRFVVLQVDGTGRLAPIITGAYHDRFVRRADGWWFAERRMTPRQLGDLSGHLRFDGTDLAG